MKWEQYFLYAFESYQQRFALRLLLITIVPTWNQILFCRYATILAFDVKVERDAQDLADSLGVKIFQADIIYHLFDKFMAYREELRQRKREEFKHVAVFPCKLKILPQVRTNLHKYQYVLRLYLVFLGCMSQSPFLSVFLSQLKSCSQVKYLTESIIIHSLHKVREMNATW